MKIKPRDLAYLQAYFNFKVSKEEIINAIYAVGNNMDDIEQYLTQRSKPHIVQLLHSNISLYTFQE
jgi:hypothetical protein